MPHTICLINLLLVFNIAPNGVFITSPVFAIILSNFISSHASRPTSLSRPKVLVFTSFAGNAWDEDSISYTQVVDLAFPPPHKPTKIFTVQYSHGLKDHREGTLVEGETVTIKSGMIFDVTSTDKS